MLIALRFKNFRSFKEQAALTLVAHNSDKSLQGSLIEAAVRRDPKMRLLPVAAIYGANAAGKTNVLSALDYMQEAVRVSQALWKPRGGTRCQIFGGSRADEPAVFEVDIVIDGIRYQYGFAANPEYFEEEWLYAYPLGRERLLFRRTTEKVGEEYKTSVKPGDTLSGDEKDIASIERRTRENSLFISAAAQDNHREATQIYNWFDDRLSIYAMTFSSESLEVARTSSIADDNGEFKGLLLNLMKLADPTIEDIVITKVDEDHSNKLIEYKDESLKRLALMSNQYRVDFLIKSGDYTMTIPFRSQSRGVRKLYSIAASLLGALKFGEVFVIDELESSMHPHIARFIVESFQDKELNKNGAQLVFTTHDTNLLDQSLLRRDEIWFVEKDACCSSLYSLLEFSPRKDENLETGYLRGRYGAIPALGVKEEWFKRDVEHVA